MYPIPYGSYAQKFGYLTLSWVHEPKEVGGNTMEIWRPTEDKNFHVAYVMEEILDLGQPTKKVLSRARYLSSMLE